MLTATDVNLSQPDSD